ncbi:SH3 domain-containing protein [Sulfurimonas sp.]
MRYILILLVTIFLVGCSLKQENLNEELQTQSVVNDLLSIPQNIEYYTKDYKEDKLFEIQKEYENLHFIAWNIQKLNKTLNEIKWPFKYFDASKHYGENLLPVKKEFLDKMYEQSNFDDYQTLNKKGLTLKYSDIRALPTSRPLLLDPSLAGEGFPFDYAQNSSVNANVPLFISHYSKDKQWVFVFTSFTFGWLKSNEVVFIDDRYTSIWQDAKQILITKEDIPLYTSFGEPLFNTRVGMMFALVDEDEDNYTILTVSSSNGLKAIYNKSKISKDFASKKTLPFNEKNLNNIINEVSKKNYGWGGIYEQRDCSSMLMDMYTPFGIWLPRNSSHQRNVGEVIDLSGFDNTQKIKVIKEKAIPFQTLLYKKGHIVLYVGLHEDEVIVFHNTWAVKTKIDNKEGRFIIGKPVFTTLKFGKEIVGYDKDSELLKNIESMNIVTR